MKGLIALLLLVTLAATAYNFMQVQQLRAEMVLLRAQLAEQKRANNLLADAIRSVQHAKDAIARVDTRSTSNALQQASAKLREAASIAGEKAGPAIRWLEEQVRGMSEQTRKPRGNAP